MFNKKFPSVDPITIFSSETGDFEFLIQLFFLKNASKPSKDGWGWVNKKEFTAYLNEFVFSTSV